MLTADEQLPRSVFSSTRYEEWRDAMSVLYVPELEDGPAYERFHVSVDGFMLAGSTLNRCTSVGQAFRRTPGQIGRDCIQSYMVQVFIEGRCHVHARDDLVMKAGDICIFDSTQPLDTYNDDFDLIAFVVPRERLAPLLHEPDGAHYACISGASPLAGLFRAHLFEIYKNAARMRQSEAGVVLGPLIQLLAAVINEGLDIPAGQRRGMRYGILQAARRYIDDNIASDRLDTARLAGYLGVSRSSLYRVFEAHEGVAAFTRKRRLSLAYARLTDPASPPRTINEIGASVGFQSESAFIRAFKRQYGKTPGEARIPENRVRQGALAAREPHALNWSNWLLEL